MNRNTWKKKRQVDNKQLIKHFGVCLVFLHIVCILTHPPCLSKYNMYTSKTSGNINLFNNLLFKQDTKQQDQTLLEQEKGVG